MFEIFDIILQVLLYENQCPIPVLNHLSYPFWVWAAFCVLTGDSELENKEINNTINPQIPLNLFVIIAWQITLNDTQPLHTIT